MARSVDTPSRPRVALQLILRGMPLPAALAVFATIVSRLQQGVNGIDLTLKPPILMHGIDSSSEIALSRQCLHIHKTTSLDVEVAACSWWQRCQRCSAPA